MIESSALVDALIGDPANPELLAVIADSELHAPALLDYEVASALRGHARGGKLADAEVGTAVEEFRALRIERYLLSAMIAPVLDLKKRFTVYDAAYAVLAQVLDAPLVTADEKMVEARKLGVDVRVLRPDLEA